MKNDKILGPLRHSGYVTTMLIANLLAGLWFTYDHMLDMADQVPCVFCRKKYRTEGSSFIWPITGKNTRVLLQVYSSFSFNRNEYVRKKPCFARLSRGSDKLDAVTSIVYDWAL